MDFPLPRLRFRFGRLGSTRTGVFFFGIILREAFDPRLVNSLVRLLGIILVQR
jgi:hypothetical protein